MAFLHLKNGSRSFSDSLSFSGSSKHSSSMVFTTSRSSSRLPLLYAAWETGLLFEALPSPPISLLSPLLISSPLLVPFPLFLLPFAFLPPSEPKVGSPCLFVFRFRFVSIFRRVGSWNSSCGTAGRIPGSDVGSILAAVGWHRRAPLRPAPHTRPGLRACRR